MTTIKKTATVKVANFTVIEGETKGGKKCLALLTDKRLSKEDFVALMTDIRTAEGYGFVKYFDEHKARLIAATKIDVATFAALANQYQWKEAEKKTKNPDKGTKATKQQAKTAAIADMASDPDFQAFLAFKAALKK